MSPIVVVRDGFSVKVNTRDHLPPHVHVWKGGALARFAVVNGKIELLSNVGMTDRELGLAARIILDEIVRIENVLETMPWTKP